ncbi:DUF4394 domain-containing protein [Erythrobacter litoralis]|uniref:DUF4394 domain-containing protein n=1 Tax=Erythrobacter litoralis TaxID=39960 RepID=UPI0024357078|nr:DUF4394 domain-containing protein [Erythrobacter litoralis]MDG6078291.1 DUF4394 domain-containing protein [Erythrobacter litoralis]
MKRLATALVITLCTASTANAATIVGVDENNNLVTFDSSTPESFDSSTRISGTTATFLALDFRDSDGLLYGLADDLRVYTINMMSGLATAVTDVLNITGSNFGFDFNTVVDAIRVVSNDDSNYVVNPEAGTASQFTDVAYGAGDPNFGTDPQVTGNAYLHGTTQQFAIGTNTDSLVMQANNAGTLTTVGSLGREVGPRVGFDIDFDGTAYLSDVSTFHTVDLSTGTATLIGTLERPVFGIAVAPAMGAVPEPAAWMMMILGFGFVGAAVRGQKRRSVQSKVAYDFA